MENQENLFLECISYIEFSGNVIFSCNLWSKNDTDVDSYYLDGKAN